MTYQVAKASDDIKAIAVVGAPTDQLQICRDRPSLYDRVMRPLVGDTIGHRQAYIDRSAIYWANELNVPTLILHGENDNRVSVSQAEKLAGLMDTYGKNVRCHIFPVGDHALRQTPQVEHQRDSLIADWFDQHL